MKRLRAYFSFYKYSLLVAVALTEKDLVLQNMNSKCGIRVAKLFQFGAFCGSGILFIPPHEEKPERNTNSNAMVGWFLINLDFDLILICYLDVLCYRGQCYSKDRNGGV